MKNKLRTKEMLFNWLVEDQDFSPVIADQVVLREFDNLWEIYGDSPQMDKAAMDLCLTEELYGSHIRFLQAKPVLTKQMIIEYCRKKHLPEDILNRFLKKFGKDRL